MQLDIRRKVRSLKWLAVRELVLTLAFFACTMGFMSGVSAWAGNPEAAVDWSWRIVLLICGLGFFGACRFEVHLLAPDEKRFLGYKAHILYFYKLAYLGISAAAAIVTAKFISGGALAFILSQLIWALAYYLMLFAFTFKYRKLLKNGQVLISYLQTATPWWQEGQFNAELRAYRPPKPKKPAPAEKPPKPKREKRPKKPAPADEPTEELTEKSAGEPVDEPITEPTEEPAPEAPEPTPDEPKPAAAEAERIEETADKPASVDEQTDK